MTAPIDEILRHLTDLVAVETTNPPREIAGDGSLVQAVRNALPGFDVDVRDLGDGSVIIEAKRGKAPVLFNVHLDTVPVAKGWSQDPFTLIVGNDRAVGLGACDIKGAAAVLFALAAHTDHPMHLVLTTDEEAGQSTCIREYVKSPAGVTQAIIAEPTSVKAVLEHRGIFSARMAFKGTSAHASVGAAKSAVHDAARWISAVIEHPLAAQNKLNVGRVEGGVKPNMIAAEAELLFGFRAAPGEDYRDLLATFDGATPVTGERTIRFVGPALPTDREGVAAAAQDRAAAWADEVGLEKSAPVDFFTEAAFFAAAGVPAMVLGPGDIAQAHTADEWVALADLARAFDVYERILRHG